MDNKNIIEHEMLTNEHISKRFKSQFDLVNHAIGLAAYLIRAGHEARSIHDDNLVLDVLEDIQYGRDQFMEIVPLKAEVELEVYEEHTQSETENPQSPKKSRIRAAK